MKNKGLIPVGRRLLILLFNVLMVYRVNAQEMPPKPVSVSIIQNLAFGAFTQSLGSGSVMIDPSGVRTSMGDVILVNYGYLYFPAIFRLEGNPGTVVHFMAGPPAILNGNLGGQMTVTLGNSQPVSPFILSSTSQNGSILIYIGGTLAVGDPLANPPGHYNGSFLVMFIQE